MELIRKGWHRVFAYVPVSTLDSYVWWDFIERKYYAIGSRTVVKKGINEDEYDDSYDLKVMHRTLESDSEKTVYCTSTTIFADPNEVLGERIERAS